MATYEIEVKSLLGSEENANQLRERLLLAGGALRNRNKQLNHYFIGGDFEMLRNTLSPHLSAGEREELARIVSVGTDFSVRTRDVDGIVYFVLKASADDTTSANGISRMEFQAGMPEMSLGDLDALLLEAGLRYQAKWSREREEYACRDCTVTVDKNAGYGYLAEFEKVVGEGINRDEVAAALRAFMGEVGAEELPQDRLERMFAYYNEHWPEYYGTDNIFTIQ